MTTNRDKDEDDELFVIEWYQDDPTESRGNGVDEEIYRIIMCELEEAPR